MNITAFCSDLPAIFRDGPPWETVRNLPDAIEKLLPTLGREYKVKDGVAIHKTAHIEPGVLLKRPTIIGPNCFVGSNALLRDGIFLDGSVTIGPGCEVKQSVIGANSSLAHFNFVGNSILGSDVNFEAGAVTANYYNERPDKHIRVKMNGYVIATGVEKFGALIGDGCKIGANAVISPGTVLSPGTVVGRLTLVD